MLLELFTRQKPFLSSDCSHMQQDRALCLQLCSRPLCGAPSLLRQVQTDVQMQLSKNDRLNSIAGRFGDSPGFKESLVWAQSGFLKATSPSNVCPRLCMDVCDVTSTKRKALWRIKPRFTQQPLQGRMRHLLETRSVMVRINL